VFWKVSDILTCQTDYFHQEYYKIVQRITGQSEVPYSDNNLINGKMNFECSRANGSVCTPNAGVSKFKFTSGKKHRLRLINGGAEGLQKFTIDNHKMTVIANDFVPVKPYEAEVITLGVGQRCDIIVEGTGSPKDIAWMRSDISTNCSHASQPHALAAVYYEKANTSLTPKTKATFYHATNCSNDALDITEPYYELASPTTPAITATIDVDFGANATNALVWKMNNESFRANYE
jgi:FtsP/CotA-like multicopper oxidase with cupredoxin domain